MTGDALLDAFAIPPGARVDQRVPKKLLLENGAPTAADKRQIQDGIEQLIWLAALKPSTIGVAAFREERREYVEIAFTRLTLRPGAKRPRLIELVHRAIPYPLVLIAERADDVSLSLAQKRWSQGQEGKIVLDGEIVQVSLEGSPTAQSRESAFLECLPLDRQPRTDLYALYSSWMDALLAYEASRVTGKFALPSSPEHAEARRVALAECTRLEGDMDRIRAAAKKEVQMPKQVELNLTLQRLRAEHAAARARL